MGLLPPIGLPRMLAVDIDGTLTDGRRWLDTDAVSALRRIEAAGIPVILATGNTRPIAWGLSRVIGCTGPVVCENGGVIWDRVAERIERLADGSEARQAADWLAERIDGLDPEGIETNAWRETEWCLLPHEDAAHIEALLADTRWSHLRVVKTGFAVHLTDPSIDKAAGLRVACGWRGVALSDVWAVGDASNDVPMFAAVGWSVAVGGAHPPALAAASAVAGAAHGQGVAAFCEATLERLVADGRPLKDGGVGAAHGMRALEG